jgi:hypothetical protein
MKILSFRSLKQRRNFGIVFYKTIILCVHAYEKKAHDCLGRVGAALSPVVDLSPAMGGQDRAQATHPQSVDEIGRMYVQERTLQLFTWCNKSAELRKFAELRTCWANDSYELISFLSPALPQGGDSSVPVFDSNRQPEIHGMSAS